MFELAIRLTLAIAIIANIIMAIFSFKCKKKYGLFLGLACLYGAMVVFFYIFSISFDSKITTSIFSSLYFICMDFMVITLFLFVYWLTEEKKTKIFKILIFLICLYGIIDIILLTINIFNPIVIDYELVFDKFKIAKYKYIPKQLFNCHLVYVYIIVTASLITLIKKVIIVPSQYKSKYLIVIAGIIVCAIINFLFLIIPQKFTDPYLVAAFNIDYALLAYSILAFFCYYSALLFSKRGMLNRLKTKIFDSLNQGLVLFDYADNMILYNQKAIYYLSEKNTIKRPSLE
ncbi:MAG: histidine kinase N-terminal 7TM domain-containing protein [Anaeroplasma sp.]